MYISRANPIFSTSPENKTQTYSTSAVLHKTRPDLMINPSASLHAIPNRHKSLNATIIKSYLCKGEKKRKRLERGTHHMEIPIPVRHISI